MTKLASFKYPKWKISNQMDSRTFVKIITRNFFIKTSKGSSKRYATPDGGGKFANFITNSYEN